MIAEEYTKHGSLSIKGFVNLGNTCYMNSALQGLLSSNILTTRIIDLLISDENALKISNPMLKEYVNLIANLIDNTSQNAIAPKKFKRTLDVENDFFKGYKQQDAHELILYLINDFVEDHDKTTKQNVLRENMSDISDKIYDTYYGTTKTVTTCTHCGHRIKERVTNCSNIILPLPKKSDITLADCFDEYSKYNITSDDDTHVTCKKCNVTGPRKIHDELDNVADVVILTLSRFSGSKKKTDSVKFYPVMCLDGKKLRLVSTINHYGSQSGGHYTANVSRIVEDEEGIRKQVWYRADDSSIRDIDPTTIYNDSSIYLAIYEACE